MKVKRKVELLNKEDQQQSNMLQENHAITAFTSNILSNDKHELLIAFLKQGDCNSFFETRRSLGFQQLTPWYFLQPNIFEPGVPLAAKTSCLGNKNLVDYKLQATNLGAITIEVPGEFLGEYDVWPWNFSKKPSQPTLSRDERKESTASTISQPAGSTRETRPITRAKGSTIRLGFDQYRPHMKV